MSGAIYFLPYQNKDFQMKKEALFQYGFQNYFGFPYKEADVFIEKLGKPFLSPLDFQHCHFNLSHSKHHMVLACNHTNIGIDIEEPRKFSSHLLRRICSKEEFIIIENSKDSAELSLLLWTLKESYTKYQGAGLSMGLSEFQVPLPENSNYMCPYFLLKSECLASFPLYFHCFYTPHYRIALCCETDHLPTLIQL